jgi:hypothetical protein
MANAHIAGANKVEETLGFWPTFHDAEVIAFSVERALPFKNGATVARLAVLVRQFRTVGEGTAQYAQILSKSVLIRFLFVGVCELELSGFNHQNVINSIEVTPIETAESANQLVDIESIWGFGGTLHCSSVEVENVEVLPIVET